MTTPEQIRSSIESIVNKNQIFAETLKDGFVDDIDQEKINMALEDIKKEIWWLTQHPEELKLFNDELRKQVEEKWLFAKKVENTSTQETDTLKTQIENNTFTNFEKTTQRQIELSSLLSQISWLKSELTDAKFGRWKEVRKTVRYIKEWFDRLEFNIQEVQSGKYTNIKEEHITWLIAKTHTLLNNANDYKSQLVTGDLDEAKKYFPPNIFNDAGYYIPDIKKWDFDNKKNTAAEQKEITPNNYNRKQDCDPKNYMKFNSGKEALAYSPLAWVQHQANSLNSNEGVGKYIGSTGKWILVWASRWLPQVADLAIKWILWFKSISSTVKGLWKMLRAGGDEAKRNEARSELWKGAKFGAWWFAYSQIERWKLWREYAWSAILQGEGFWNKDAGKEANEKMNYPIQTSTLLGAIPFASLSTMLAYDNSGKVESINLPLLKQYIDTADLSESDRKLMRTAYESLEKTQNMDAIKSAFTTVGLNKDTIEEAINDPKKWTFVYRYKTYNDKLMQEEKKKKEKINNSGEVYDGKDIANVKPYLAQIEKDITDSKLKLKYTKEMQATLEKKLNILYMQHPKSGPIYIYFDKATNKINLKSYNQESTLDILSENYTISTPYAATSRAASSLEEAINIGQLHNLLTAPAPLWFAWASTIESPFNLSYTETERDIEFNKTDRWTAMKNLSFKQGTDTNILEDTRANNFDENFPSINNKKSEFINWLNSFKKNGKSLWKK